MIGLDEYVNGDNGCYVLPNVSILKTIKLASNTQYFNRHLSMFSMRYGIDVPLADKNGNVIPYQLVVEEKNIRGTPCHYGHYIHNGKVFHTIIIAKWDL